MGLSTSVSISSTSEEVQRLSTKSGKGQPTYMFPLVQLPKKFKALEDPEILRYSESFH